MTPEPGRSQTSTRVPATIPPFAWQHDRQLFILDRSADGWVFAELRFDPVTCRYREVRRATYEWLREVAGVLLARTIAVDPARRRQLEAGLSRWIAHFTGQVDGTA